MKGYKVRMIRIILGIDDDDEDDDEDDNDDDDEGVEVMWHVSWLSKERG